MTDADLDSLIDAGTALLAIPVDPDWRAAIRQHLAVSLQQARMVAEFSLPDEADPAPVFRT